MYKSEWGSGPGDPHRSGICEESHTSFSYILRESIDQHANGLLRNSLRKH